MCEDCPYKQGVTDPEGFSLAEFLLKIPDDIGPALGSGASMRCGSCGFTPADFKKMGRFGCPDCYDSFRGMLKPMLLNMHRDVCHKGKIPERALERVETTERLDRLNRELKTAIATENYEDAARLRDALSELKAVQIESASSEGSKDPR